MAQHNLDNQIKEKLNAREIQPSAQAWDRLDAMLTVSEEKNSKKGYGWFFVAASMLLFFGLGFFLLNSNETTENTNSTPVVTTINEETDSTRTNIINEISVKKVQPVLVQNETNFSKKVISKKSTETKELKKEENVIQENTSPNTQHPTPINYKYVSPEELLAEVQTGKKEITTEKKIISKPNIKMDANALLTTVEQEIKVEYRESTFEKLKRNYNQVKTAVANRNYE